MDASFYDDIPTNLRHEKTCMACKLIIFGNFVQVTFLSNNLSDDEVTGGDGAVSPELLLLLRLQPAPGGGALLPGLGQQALLPPRLLPPVRAPVLQMRVQHSASGGHRHHREDTGAETQTRSSDHR